jgi:peptide/nickel transport system ATP-binding protein
MRQRAVLAIALCLKPRLLVLDEPTTALDVLTQRAVLDRLKALQNEFQFGMLFVTHDLPLLFEVADRILVLYAGRCAELGSPQALARDARHPYTRALIQSVPDWLHDAGPAVGIPGSPPSLNTPPTGCRFHPRCARAQASCREQHPEPRNDGERLFACHNPWS